jgi:preprotein translocase subunit SecA
MLDSVKTSTVTTLMKNSPEDLAMFTAITLDEPVMALNYTSGDDLINQTSFTGAAMAAGEYAEADDGLADRPLPNVAAGGGRGATATSTAPVQVQQRVVFEKVGRNDPCPCGSGKKYKKCHGA